MTEPDHIEPQAEEAPAAQRRRDREKHAETRQADHPWSEEAEKGLLSCLLNDPQNLLPQVRAKVAADAFYHMANELVYTRLVAMWDASLPIDLVSLTHELRQRGELEKAGGAAAVSELLTFAPVTLHCEYYVGILLEKYHLRQTMALAQKVMVEAATFGRKDDQTSAAELISQAESQFFDLLQKANQQTREGGAGPKSSRQCIDQWVEHMETVIANRGRIMGLTTGIHEMDLTLHGLDDKEGEIFTIAGRPGMGKTAMGVSIENHFIEQDYPGMTFSLEMSSNQWQNRLVLGSAGIPIAAAQTGFFSYAQSEAMTRRARQIAKAKRIVNDTSSLTTADLRAQCIIAKRKHNIRWVLVDHLKLVNPVSDQGRKEERMAIEETMKTLQWIKKELRVVVILLVQMNREADRTAGKPPVMADLGGSASIEHYSDHIVFLYRPSKYYPWHRLSEDQQNAWRQLTEPRRQRSPELWVQETDYADEDGGFARADYEEDAICFFAKNRRGPTPEFHVRYQGPLTWYSTRMPTLNSTHPLDQQIGTYQVGRGRSASGSRGGSSEPVQQRRGRPRKDGGQSSMDDVFPDE